MTGFDPTAHPRRTDGRFATKPGAASGEPDGIDLAGEGRAGRAGRFAHATPADIDARLDELLDKHYRAAAHMRAETALLAEKLGVRPAGSGRHLPDPEELLARAEGTHDAQTARAGEALRATRDRLAGMEKEMGEIEEEFDARGGWTRAFLTQGANGHVHSSMDCPTCNRDGRATRFSLMHAWSGAQEDRIVADAGWRACTVCYPSAPVGDAHTLPDRMGAPARRDAKKPARPTREERARAKAAKKKAEAATADGSVLTVPTAQRTLTFHTEATAQQWAIHQTIDLMNPLTARPGDSPDRTESIRAGLDIVAASLGNKHGRAPGDLIAQWQERAHAEVVRQVKENWPAARQGFAEGWTSAEDLERARAAWRDVIGTEPED